MRTVSPLTPHSHCNSLNRSVTHTLHERRDNPIFYLIMNLLALAFADGAFEEEGIKTPEDIYNLEIPHCKEVLAI